MTHLARHFPGSGIGHQGAGSFDNIAQESLLNKLDTIPCIRRAVKAWLRAGILAAGVMTPTTAGTPQGGCASPLLANIALHGLEQAAAAAVYPAEPGEDRRRRPVLIRYADDVRHITGS